MSDRVGIFVAGVQKSGTTALFEYLRAHPALMPPRVKETHHFDNEALDWTRDVVPLFDAFYDAPDPARRRFEATPISLFWPPSLARIRAYNPNSQLIILFRDPILRAYSHWWMEALRGTEDLCFSDAIRAGRARLSPQTPLDANWRDRSYVERGFYGAQLARALIFFPRAQMLLLASDDLRRRHQGVLDRISAFLDIPACSKQPPRTENQSPPAPPMADADRAYLRELYADDMERFEALSGIDVTTWERPA